MGEPLAFLVVGTSQRFHPKGCNATPRGVVKWAISPEHGACAEHPVHTRRDRTVNILLLVIIIIAIILAVTGGFVASIHWLLWVGIVVLVVAAIVWLVRALTGSRRV